jgi:hypothetical protein
MKRLRVELTYANVISTLALFLAVAGGGAFAASTVGSSAPATLRLCAAKKSGNLRLPSGRGSCKAGERALTVDSRGATGIGGPAGPAGVQGERGPAGPTTTSLASPDGRYTVAASDTGIVLTGPGGSVTFDGRKISSDGDLQINVAQKLALTNGTALEITSGSTASLTTGANFTQTVGGAYEQSVGAGYSQSVGSGYEQTVAEGYSQTIGGGDEQSVGGAFKQLVDGNYDAESFGTALLEGSTVDLGGSSCPAAARVGSEIDGFGRVAAKGSSAKVFVC